jgi:hypothetical protein
VVRLEPGTYSLRVTVDDVLVRTIDDVHVPKSGTVHDPRCIPIDLRGSVPAAADPGDTSELIRTLRVVDGRGVPIEHGIWRFESSGHWASWRPWLGGEVIVLAPFTRIEVWSPGYALREGAPPAGAATWELKPAPTIELVFELPPELHTRDVRLRAQAELSWDETRRLDWMLRGYEPVTDIDPSGRARFRFPAGREWLIEVHAAWGAGESAEGAELQQFRIQPDDAPAGEPLRLKPDAAKWLEILRDKGAPILPSRE